jgi:hypothetical protein
VAAASRPTGSSAPPRVARLLAFVAIVVAGACGGLIGWSITDLQCGGDDAPAVVGGPPVADDAGGTEPGCGLAAGLGALTGALVAAGGVAVIAVLVLRARAEWADHQRQTLGPPGPMGPPASRGQGG